MPGDIQYNHGGFHDDNTKVLMRISPQELRSFASEIARAYKGKPSDLTICVAVVQHGGYQMLVYTANRNKTSEEIRQKAEDLGIVRWEQAPRTTGRGAVGSPGDAEQILFEAADVNTSRVMAVAPSNKACKDCEVRIQRRRIPYFGPEPPSRSKTSQPNKRTKGEHKERETEHDEEIRKKPPTKASDQEGEESKRKAPTNGTEGSKITNESRGLKPKAPSLDVGAEPTGTSFTAKGANGLGSDNSAVSKKGIPETTAGDFKTYAGLLSRLKTTTANIASPLQRMLSFYSALDSILSSFEQIQSAMHLMVSGREKSNAELAAEAMYQSAIEVNGYAKQLWANVSDAEFDRMVQQGMDTTDELQVLLLSGEISSIKSRPQEILNELEDFNRRQEPIQQELAFLIPKLTYLLENATGSVLVNLIAEFQNETMSKMPLLRLLTSVFSVENYSVNTLEIGNLREVLYGVNGRLSPSLKLNRESIACLRNVVSTVDGYGKKIQARLIYVSTHYQYKGPGWAVDE